jgi:hypothetical protein
MILSDNYSEYQRKRNSKNKIELRTCERIRDSKRIIQNFRGDVEERTIVDIGGEYGDFLNLIKQKSSKLFIVEIPPINNLINQSIQYIDINSLPKNLDTVLLRGVCQYLDDYQFQIIFETIYESFQNSTSKNNKLLFIYSNPNPKSIRFKKYQLLPATLGEQSYIKRIRSLDDFNRLLLPFNYEMIKVEYPYLTSCYSSIFKDFMNFCAMYFSRVKNHRAWFNQMFNVTYRFNPKQNA